jgi:polynucleotide 5'-hydroxyl-kinase GRC3/NOL9
VPKRAVVQDLVSPPQWNKAIAETIAGQAPTVLVCGPKSSGKSTFGRILANKLLTSLSSKARTTGVAVLDLDPGQPEFAPAGIISLVHCAGPNLSPPFAHAIADGTTTIHRSHATGSLTPASDPHLYLEACLDLFAHYTRGLSRCPLVVNTPGWVQGTGLDLLVELVAGINPSHVVYMSEDGPGESVESLSGASRGRFVALPSQQAEFSSRTAAHLRAMQAMSYFHGGRVGGLQAWDPTPVTARVPWEVCYGGASPGIAAVLCYEFQPPAELLAEAINGAVLSLVEAEDAKALRELDGPAFAEAMDVDDSEDVGVDASAPSTIPSSTVSRSPEGLPYILNPDSTSLDPRHSRALGHVLVRGIDPARRALQLLTPVSLDSIRAARAAGHALVLVLGRLDAPAWAYTEDLYERTAPAETARGVGDDNDGSESEGEGEGDMGGGGLEGGAAPAEARRVAGADVPWIETLEGHEKRPAGSKAWRVRRDLGRGGNEA